VPDAAGTVRRLPDGRTGNGRDEGQRQRADLLAGGRRPPGQAEEGRVQGTATGTAARR